MTANQKTNAAADQASRSPVIATDTTSTPRPEDFGSDLRSDQSDELGKHDPDGGFSRDPEGDPRSGQSGPLEQCNLGVAQTSDARPVRKPG